MATQVLNSKIRICKNINIDKNYTNVLNYTENEMLSLCESQSHLVASSNTFSFIRNKGTIATKFDYDDVLKSNYVAFQNPDYSNKWFFAWIDDVIYNGEKNTEIKYTIDAWSTWFDYWTQKACFVSREHVNDDTVGLHTIPEDLNIGQIIADWEQTLNDIGSESTFWFVIACNYDPSNSTRYAGVGSYASFPQGNMWFAWNVNVNNYASTFNDISDWVFNVTQAGQDGNIQAMFALPQQAFSLSDVDNTTHKVTIGGGNKLNTDKTYSKSSVNLFSDYTPKNNKLKVYPYSFIRVTNNLGSVNDYKFEDFKDLDNLGQPTDNFVFNLIGVPCVGYSGKIRPKYYQGLNYNEDESIALGKYPSFSWSSDGFTNWMTQNAINLGVNIVGTAVSGATQMASGNIIGGANTVASSAGSMIGSMFQASMGSNTAQGNANAGDISFSQNLTRFKVMHMRPKKEYLEIIDDYFTRFGYKINRVKVPNITGRTYWNYIEIGASEDIGYGDVPAIYMDIINNACRKGITIWHNHANIGNYSLSNTIVT